MDEVSIEKARARLGDYVNDAQNGTPVLITRSGRPAAMLVPLTLITDADRRLAIRARELEAARDIQEHTGEADIHLAYIRAFGEARHLLGELAAIVDRLAGDQE